MDIQMRLYWETFSEFFSTTDIIRLFNNPLRDYNDELVDGAIADIGCGQTSFLLDYIDSGRMLIGIDNDQYQLDRLKTRFEEITNFQIDALKLENIRLLHQALPNDIYSAVFMANILHFFSLTECDQIIAQLEQNLVSGSFIYVSVHSEKHHANDPDDLKNNDYFKHYFTRSDLDALFSAEKYDRIFFADVERSQTKKEKQVKIAWIEKCLDHVNVQDPDLRQSTLKKNTMPHLENDLVCLYRRK